MSLSSFMEPVITTEPGEKINPEYIAMLRKMTVAEKFEKMAELHRAEVARKVAMVRENYPQFPEAEADRLARSAMLYESLATEG